MIARARTVQRIVDSGLVAVVRAGSTEQAEKISDACVKGGITAVEVTFTVPGASEVIKGLRARFSADELLVGAGTVLDSETAMVAILAGSDFIVGPTFSLEVAKLCNRYQKPYIPGCMSVTEVVTAMEAGVDIVKLFPGEAFGPGIIKSIKGPLPQASIMPTGGVSLKNVGEWIKAGAAAVGIGSKLTGGAKHGDYEEVTRSARLFLEAIKAARQDKIS